MKYFYVTSVNFTNLEKVAETKNIIRNRQTAAGTDDFE